MSGERRTPQAIPLDACASVSWAHIRLTLAFLRSKPCTVPREWFEEEP